MKLFFLVCLSIISVNATESKANSETELMDLEMRVLELELRQKEMNEWYNNFYLLGKGRVVPYLNQSIYLGGFFESAVTHLYGPDMDRQTSANSQTLGFNITAKFNDRMKFVTQTLTRLLIPLRNLNNNPNAIPPQRKFVGFTFFSIVTQGYFEYLMNDYFNIQAGIGYAPYGIVFQQREPELFRLRGGSQVITYDDGDTVGIGSPLWTGLHFYGAFSPEKKEGYNLYSLTPINAVETLGVGGRLWTRLNDNAVIGTSVQSGEQRKGTYFSHGFDLDLNYRTYGFVSEYGHASNSGEVLDAEFYYFEPYVKFKEGEWVIFLNAEYIDTLARTEVLTSISDPVKKWQYGGGLNWLPISNARFRLTYLYHDYVDEADSIGGQKRDYNVIDFSTAVAF